MNEYIEREATYNVLTEYYHHSTEVQHEALREAIMRVPSAEVGAIVHGEWEYDENGYDWNLPAWRCSKCHAVNGNIPPWIKTQTGVREVNPLLFSGSNFCPNCGADMRGNKNG